MSVSAFWPHWRKRFMTALRKIKVSGARGDDILRVMLRKYQESEMEVYAASMSYSFFLAIFPGLIFLLSLLPYLPVDNFETMIFQWMKGVLPSQAYDIILSTVSGIFNKKSIGFLSLYFLSVIFFATRGVNMLVLALNEMAFDEKRSRNFLLQQSHILVMFLGLFVIALLGLVVLLGGEIALHILFRIFNMLQDFEYRVLLALNWLIEFLLLVSGISFIYYWAPRIHRPLNLGFFSPGALVSAVLVIAAQVGLRYYFANFAAYNKIYGSLGAVIMLMIWFYWMSYVILLGFLINIGITRSRRQEWTGNLMGPTAE